jgi:pseudouridine synthase
MLVDAERDRVTVHGELVRPPAGHRYLALHKPAGVLVTARDPGGRPTIYELLPDEERRRHLVYVGRLDLDSAGLLLLTDDGDLAYRLTHPRYEVPREYVVNVAGVPEVRDLQRLREGVRLDDGPTRPAQVELLGAAAGRARLRVTIHEGRKRQVRRMLDAVGHPVEALTRTGIGPLRLGRLRPGGYRALRPAEVEALRNATGMKEAR